jgi:hypothetical protein
MDSRNRLPLDSSAPTNVKVAVAAPPQAVSSLSEPVVDVSSAPLSPRVRNGLRMLLQAYEYAVDVETSLWEFAVERPEMRSHGLTSTDLRWLVMKGWVEQGIETTLPGESRRSFRSTKGLRFLKRTGFVLTPLGVEAARAVAVGEFEPITRAEEGLENDAADASISAKPDATPASRVVPLWDADLQELRVNGLIVKQFKVPAPNQEMVLAAFQEEGWPARIDDPLPPQADQDPKRRLHDTIVSLNRTHKHRMIRFMGDGSGEGVRWTIVTDGGE